MFHVLLAEDKRVMEENHLAINILHYDEECLGCSMDLLVPAEIWDGGQVDPEQ
jgi:hypothetical protein